MKLFASITSPYARKIHICLIEQGIDFEFIAESPSDPKSNVARLNPLGKVPLLQCDNGEVVFNSPMIVDYIDSLATGILLPDEAESRWQVQRWHALADGMMDAVVARMLEGRRTAEKQDMAFIEKQQHKVAASLDFATHHLSKDLKFLCGDSFTIADIAMAVALDYTDFRYAHNWKNQHPTLARWQAEINQRASFLRTLPVD